MRAGTEGSRALLKALSTVERGPRRDGTFAVWLTIRVATDLVHEPAWGERAHRKRLQSLEGRFTSLSLPPALRRAFTATLSQLRPLSAEATGMALTQLVAPVRESLGAEAADAVRRVAVSLRGR